MKMRNSRGAISGAFVFLLLGIFALFSTLMVLLSAQLYRATVDQTAWHNERRVLGSYLMNVARSNDADGALELLELEGTPVLALGFDSDGERYQTQIYLYDGHIRERFAAASEPFEPDYGEPICPAQAFEPSIDGDLLRVRVVDSQGNEEYLHVALRCGAREGARA